MSATTLTVEQAAAELEVHKQTVYRLIYSGALAYTNISTGRKRARIRITRAALEQYLRERERTVA